MSDVVRRYTVVIEQEPFALILHNAMVCGPTYDWIKDDALIGKGAIRIVTNSIAEHVAVACRIAEIIFAIILMHPRSLKEAVGISSLQRLTVLIENQH